MSRRISTRLAAKQTDPLISDKENNAQHLSKPIPTPVPGTNNASNKKRVTSGKQTITTQGRPKSGSTSATPTSVSKLDLAPKSTAKPEAPNDDVKNKQAALPISSSTKRKRASPAPKAEEEDDELPHNMGKRAPAKPKVKEETTGNVSALPKTKAKKSARREERAQDAKELMQGAKEPPKKKVKKAKANPYGLTPGETPFPDWPHPTPEEAQVVHDLLLNTIEPDRRKRFFPPDNIPVPSEVVAGCGEVPSILDALIRTLLSAATNGQNSSNAFQGLVKRFGLATDGVGKGSVNWNAVHEASLEDVFEAIKCGGLADTKSKNIKKILAMVHAENEERLATLLKIEEEGAPNDEDDEEKAERALELHALKQGHLTLDYYHHLEKDEALTTFSAYPGIGVKTAACVNLFCMQRPCFAVDTHVFRLCQYLGWVPPETPSTDGKRHKKVDRNTTFSHCEVRIPDELKYGLHQLFLEHGKKCPRCRAVTGEKSEGWAEANCVIEHLVKRLGAKKGGTDSPKKKAAKGKKSRKGANSDDDDEDDIGDAELSESELTEEVSSTAKTSTRERASTKKTTKSAAAINRTGAGPSTKIKAASAPKPAILKRRTPIRKKSVKRVEGSEEEAGNQMSDLTDAPESSDHENQD